MKYIVIAILLGMVAMVVVPLVWNIGINLSTLLFIIGTFMTFYYGFSTLFSTFKQDDTEYPPGLMACKIAFTALLFVAAAMAHWMLDR